MRNKNLKLDLVGLVGVAVLAGPASAVPGHAWRNPCVTPLDCLFDFCWCEGDWDDPNNWVTNCTGGWVARADSFARARWQATTGKLGLAHATR